MKYNATRALLRSGSVDLCKRNITALRNNILRPQNNDMRGLAIEGLRAMVNLALKEELAITRPRKRLVAALKDARESLHAL